METPKGWVSKTAMILRFRFAANTTTKSICSVIVNYFLTSMGWTGKPYLLNLMDGKRD